MCQPTLPSTVMEIIPAKFIKVFTFVSTFPCSRYCQGCIIKDSSLLVKESEPRGRLCGISSRHNLDGV